MRVNSEWQVAWTLLLILYALPALGAGTAPRVIGYLTESGVESGHYTVKNIVMSGAAPLLTQIDYAFGRVVKNRCEIDNEEAALAHAYTAETSVDGTADLGGADDPRGAFHQLLELKRKYPQLKVVISLGGWGGSSGFSNAADPANVRNFVHSCVATFLQGRAAGVFDGVDIDWEYPVGGGLHHAGKPEDKKNFTAMLAEFRRQLDAIKPGLLLSAALPAGEEDFAHFELEKIGKYLDEVSIMAYDLHWNTERITNFHSALFHAAADPSDPSGQKRFGDYAVQAFLKAGIAPEKLILGVPFYGKGYAPVGDGNHGLYQPSVRPSKLDGSYRALKALPGRADRQYYPRVASCSVWLDGNFWSYDCPEAMKAKREYALRERLGGVMFWELSQDTDSSELLRALAGR